MDGEGSGMTVACINEGFIDNNCLWNFDIITCAVIFGADVSLLGVQLDEGFSFRRMSLNPNIDHLNLIFETDAMALRRDYESARIDESLDVICIYKEQQVRLREDDAETYYHKACDNILWHLDNKIRAIRLLVEGPVRFKKLSIKMKSEVRRIGETDFHDSFTSLIPIPEAVATKTLKKFSCGNYMIDKLNLDIININFPLKNNLLNSCHIYYDLSYHQSNFISVTLLITCLEILFLKHEYSKRKNLSSRCAVFLNDNKDDRIACYERLSATYKKRSDFVHDGNYDSIDASDILFLRDCVRKALLKYMRANIDKVSEINRLNGIIAGVDYLK